MYRQTINPHQSVLLSLFWMDFNFKALRNKIPLEYLVLVLCWIFWGMTQSFSWNSYAKNPGIATIVYVKGIQSFIALFFNVITVLSIYKISKHTKSKYLQYALVVLTVIALCYVLVLINSSLYRYLQGKPVNLLAMVRYTALAFEKLIYIGGFSTVFLVIRNKKQWKEQQEKLKEARYLTREAQLMMLQYQLNPHFLFNALNSIRSLVNENGEKARSMITELSEFLRSVLMYNEKSNSTIEKELDIVNHYLIIQKIRYENDLVYTINLQDNVKNVEIPCFVIQPLVENSIKFGMNSTKEPLSIDIKVKRVAEEIEISVTNNGTLNNDNYKPGTGIKNIRQRLALFYGENANFQLNQVNENVVASIKIIH
ncbi:MAG: histidine kinase [Bacteroidales bacterium]|nr:histidine kinase [Bacteroidales bacterium]